MTLKLLSWNVLDPSSGFQPLEPQDGHGASPFVRTVINPASNCAFVSKTTLKHRVQQFPLFTTAFSKTTPEQEWLSSEDCSPKQAWIVGQDDSEEEAVTKAETEEDCVPYPEPPPGRQRLVEFEGKWCHDFVTGLAGSAYAAERQHLDLELLRLATTKARHVDALEANIVCLQEVDAAFHDHVVTAFHRKFFVFFDGELLTMVRRSIVDEPPMLWTRDGRVTQVVCRLKKKFGGLGVSIFNLHFAGGAPHPREDIEYIMQCIRDTSLYMRENYELPMALSLVMGDFNFSLEDYDLQDAFALRIQGVLNIDSILVHVDEGGWPATWPRPSIQTLESNRGGWPYLERGIMRDSLERAMKRWSDLGSRRRMLELVARGKTARKEGRHTLRAGYVDHIKGLHKISDHPPLYLSVTFDDDALKPPVIYQDGYLDAAINLYDSFDMQAKP
jgi:hypothetical protein